MTNYSCCNVGYKRIKNDLKNCKGIKKSDVLKTVKFLNNTNVLLFAFFCGWRHSRPLHCWSYLLKGIVWLLDSWEEDEYDCVEEIPDEEIMQGCFWVTQTHKSHTQILQSYTCQWAGHCGLWNIKAQIRQQTIRSRAHFEFYMHSNEAKTLHMCVCLEILSNESMNSYSLHSLLTITLYWPV